jgi:hypothetical protein
MVHPEKSEMGHGYSDQKPRFGPERSGLDHDNLVHLSIRLIEEPQLKFVETFD